MIYHFSGWPDHHPAGGMMVGRFSLLLGLEPEILLCQDPLDDIQAAGAEVAQVEEVILGPVGQSGQILDVIARQDVMDALAECLPDLGVANGACIPGLRREDGLAFDIEAFCFFPDCPNDRPDPTGFFLVEVDGIEFPVGVF